MIVNCCATCIHAHYVTKKSKTIQCSHWNRTKHQLEHCFEYDRDIEKVDRINTYLRGVR